MLSNIEPAEDLRKLARNKARQYETKSVGPRSVGDASLEGWVVSQRNKKSVQLRRPKSHNVLLEDRVWTLLYRMGFTHLSGIGGGRLLVDPKNPKGATTQIDAVAIDAETAIAIECKSATKLSKRPQFQDELGKHILIRERFSKAINFQYANPKRQVVLAMFLSNITLSENDRSRAREANVMLFDDRDLAYYESLLSHIGPAAKYQFLADMLQGKTVQGLFIRVPAVRTKMGGSNCYTFSISPEYLLKISYVSHRSKGKPSDVDTYQRMLSKTRLKDIKEYITKDGIFPTNVVVNLDAKRLNFERIRQETVSPDEQDNGVAGWLSIRPAYKSAWIIDGQHRLFAYSGHERARTSRLSVLAFEGLPPSTQAKLFIDINAKQRSVRRSLLEELYGELHWDSDDPAIRIRAIISKAVQALGMEPDSALYRRIQTADVTKDVIRCISLTSVFSALHKPEFYIVKEKNGQIVEYGPLWAGTNEATLKRTIYVVKRWLNSVRDAVPDWWEKGADVGGGLAMNDGVTTCINVLRSVFQHLDSAGRKPAHKDDDDLFELTREYANALGAYFQSLSEEDRKRFRDLRGAAGQLTRTRRCQAAIRERIPSFNPPGLDEFLHLEKAQTNKQGKEVIDRIERILQRVVVEALRREIGPEEHQWWMEGVPKPVRLKVTGRFEDDDGKRGGKENYFDLIDYRAIALANWEIFEPILAYGTSGNKEKKTNWMAFINEKRKIVSHASSAATISLEHLADLQVYDTWLSEQITELNHSIQE
jgi:DNA sulfur modification protein DndB